jgi:hypothetical protein
MYIFRINKSKHICSATRSCQKEKEEEKMRRKASVSKAALNILFTKRWMPVPPDQFYSNMYNDRERKRFPIADIVHA